MADCDVFWIPSDELTDLKSGYASDGVQAAHHDHPILDTRVDRIFLESPAATSDDSVVPVP